MNKPKLLPLGSVVQLTTTPTSILIIGYNHPGKESGKRYDYLGVSYPYGITLSMDSVKFNADAIKNVEFEQTESEEAVQFREAMETFMSIKVAE